MPTITLDKVPEEGVRLIVAALTVMVKAAVLVAPLCAPVPMIESVEVPTLAVEVGVPVIVNTLPVLVVTVDHGGFALTVQMKVELVSNGSVEEGVIVVEAL